MMRRWLKPCPRCRGNHLFDMRDDRHRTVNCVQCGYGLTPDEIRFLIEDIVLENESERTAA